MKSDSKIDKQLEDEFAEDVIDLKSKLSLITGVESSDETVVTKKPGRIIKMMLPTIAIAASLILAIIFIPGLWSDGDNDVYSQYYEPYEMALNQRGNSTEVLNDAISAYQVKDYDKASKLFKTSFISNGDAIHLLYAASAEQAKGNYLIAIDLYDQVIANKNEKVIEQAQWYKALSLIGAEKIEEAKATLLEFDKLHYKYNDAKKLLNNL